MTSGSVEGATYVTLVIEPQLYSRVEPAADEHKIGIDRILTEALRRYLWELDRRKISEESQTYQQRHAELKAQYLGQYIAIGSLRLPGVFVVGDEQGNEIVLSRNVLNKLRLLLDGPAGQTDIRP